MATNSTNNSSLEDSPPPSKSRARRAQFCNVALAPYGTKEGRDGRNAVVLLTNCIRHEVQDIFHVLRVIDQRSRVLTHSMVEDLFTWLNASFDLMRLSVDELFDNLLPSIDALQTTSALSSKQLRLMAGETRMAMMLASETQDSFNPNLPAGERFPVLVTACKRFEGVLNHLDTIDATLPPLLIRALTSKTLHSLEKSTITSLFSRATTRNTVLGTMTRWMNAGQTAHLKSQLSMFKSSKLAKARAAARVLHGFIPEHIAAIMEREENEGKEDGYGEELRTVSMTLVSGTTAGGFSDMESEGSVIEGPEPGKQVKVHSPELTTEL